MPAGHPDDSAPFARPSRRRERLWRLASRAALALGLGWATASTLAQPTSGAELYGRHCAACHQPDGAGTVGLAPPIKGEQWTRLGAERNYLPTVLLHGLSGPIRLPAGNFVGVMPAFAAQLDDAALATIATHVRQLQGATGEAAYGADELKALRAQPGASPAATRQKRQQLLGG